MAENYRDKSQIMEDPVCSTKKTMFYAIYERNQKTEQLHECICLKDYWDSSVRLHYKKIRAESGKPKNEHEVKKTKWYLEMEALEKWWH